MLNEKEFPFLAEKGHIISLVGGGGKTTLLYAMAAHCARKGWRVLVMTTTHILQPSAGLWARNDAELAALWTAGRYAVAGTPALENKLTLLPEPQRTAWIQKADVVLIEADGAKHYPCKVPAAHEPVLLPQSDLVLAVAGLSAMERPLREVCFRWELALPWLPDTISESLVTPSLLAQLLTGAQGGRKLVGNRSFCIVLNQADTPERRYFGQQTQEILQKDGISCVLTQFEERERA